VTEGIDSGLGRQSMDESKAAAPPPSSRISQIIAVRRYTLSRKAEEDVIAIFMYGVADFGIQQTERHHSQLEHTFQFLAENPKAARECLQIRPPVRSHPWRTRTMKTWPSESSVYVTTRDSMG
jgi:plasmid stabilization system protein ParE